MVKNVLDYYVKKGWLKYEQNIWQPLDRYSAAMQLLKDFTNAGIDIKTIDFTRERIDCGGFREPSDFRMRAENRFRKAIRAIDDVNYLRAVHKCVLQNQQFCPKCKIDLTVCKSDLVRGLDKLCDYYSKTIGKRY